YTYTFEHERKDGCPVCGEQNTPVPVRAKRHWTLQEFINVLPENPQVQAKKPSLRSQGKSLYLQAPKQLEEATRPNLEKKLRDLVEEGDEVVVTDAGLPFSVRLSII